MKRKAMITGITGQDGSYLAELLLSKGYEVHGIIRRSSTFNTGRIAHIFEDAHASDRRLFLHYGDMTSHEQVSNLVQNIRPAEIYHLAAQSHVQVSFVMPEYTNDVGALGTIRILEAIRRSDSETRFYNAASSEMFGNEPAPQSENTSFRPRSPYAVSKVHSYWMTRMYREGYGLFALSGILFNHESPRRGETFVTRKITRAIARIVAGKQKKLYMGNLDARRDWGYSPEYVEAMWRMLQLEEPDDFVLGMGESHTVRDFVQAAFSYVELDWEEHVEIDQQYFRPLEVEALRSDPSKARAVLQWQPKIAFDDLVRIMVDADLQALGLDCPGDGEKVLRREFQDWHQWDGAVIKSLAAQQTRDVDSGV
jgi:GDPmannose 4,6-dehydratase